MLRLTNNILKLAACTAIFTTIIMVLLVIVVFFIGSSHPDATTIFRSKKQVLDELRNMIVKDRSLYSINIYTTQPEVHISGERYKRYLYLLKQAGIDCISKHLADQDEIPIEGQIRTTEYLKQLCSLSPDTAYVSFHIWGPNPPSALRLYIDYVPDNRTAHTRGGDRCRYQSLDGNWYVVTSPYNH